MQKCLSILSAVAISACSSITFAANTPSDHYVIFVDAGSTGSRLHLFQYAESKSVPVIQDVFSESVKPGLSSFADHPEAAGASLKKSFDDATAYLQQHGVDLANVHVHANVLATAGMRLVAASKQKAIYDNVNQYLKTNYKFTLDNVQTITGKMEGLYGWLDVNYLANNFQTHHVTLGSIDMGGASTQIAFETADISKAEDEVNVRIDNQNYHVFSKSFLGLGQDQARDTMNTANGAANCYPVDYVYSGTTTGHYNLASCRANYADIIAHYHVVQQIVPTLNQPFVAYSGIYYTYNFLNTDKTPEQATVESHIQSVCNETWEQLQKDYPQVAPKYLSTYCAGAAYQDQLLYDAYQLHGNQLTVATQLNQHDIDWTLGAALYSLVR